MMQVQHGDIVVFHGHGFVSQGIQFFMNVWRWVNFQFKPFYKKVPNHIAMGDYDNMIIEAAEHGIKRQNFMNKLHYKSTIKVYRYDWSKTQTEQINKAYAKYINIPYEYGNFIYWMVYILTFKLIWLGRKGEDSDRKLYCSEFAARIIHDCTYDVFAKSEQDKDAHQYFVDYWKINPLQMERWCEANCTLVETYEIE